MHPPRGRCPAVPTDATDAAPDATSHFDEAAEAFLLDLLDVPAPSGFEEPAAAAWLARAEQLGLRCRGPQGAVRPVAVAEAGAVDGHDTVPLGDPIEHPAADVVLGTDDVAVQQDHRRPGTLLPWTIKLCLALGLGALGATQYLSRAVEGGALRQREARAVLVDPETTGSIGPAAARTTLDPCTASGLRR